MEIQQTESRRRIPELDFLRGCALTLMMFHHTIGDLYDIYHQDFVAFQHSYWFYEIGRPLVLIIFLSVSGASSRFSRNSLKRGFRMVIFAITATALSIFVDGFTGIGLLLFNVIHVVAFSTVAYALLERLAVRLKWIPDPNAEKEEEGGDAVEYRRHLFPGLLIIIGMVSIFVSTLITPILPAYSSNPFLIMLGAPAKGVHLLDHMPLFPWIGFFLSGAAVGHTLYATGEAFTKYDGRFYKISRPIRFLGRHSLWVYFVHQPIILFILFLLNKTGIFG
ncbi:MAG: DUF1624 domain-containing protein [Clostridiaceae bacterium]|nr:DUF1624 domain-containing protein [Clostridiaceae bacterium]